MIQIANAAPTLRRFFPHPKPSSQLRIIDAPADVEAVRFVAKTERDANGRQDFYALGRGADGRATCRGFFKQVLAAEVRKAELAGASVEVVEFEAA